jgi:leader peptidase (prepilin peptidase)/N-methyltransferase
MPGYMTLMLASGAWIWLLFAFAFGACAGSLINVLVYRLPLGLSVVTPPSRCPACGTRLTWRENIPVFGWLLLRGRCRFCKSRISPEYPMVEAFVGFLFAAFFFMWYVMPSHAVWLGVDWAAVRPEWAHYDASLDKWPRQSWPMFLVLISLVASLVAMSLVDLKTYTIPLQIPWFATIVAVLFHVGYAVFLNLAGFELRSMRFDWSIPTPTSWWYLGASLGGMMGLLIANVMLHKGWLRRSFADYAAWEDKHFPKDATQATATEPAAGAPVDPNREGFPWVRRMLKFLGVFVVVAAALTAAGALMGRGMGLPPWAGLVAGVVAGPFVAAFAVRLPRASGQGDDAGVTGDPVEPGAPADMWIQYPHARREMVKEILFLTPCVGLGWLGGTLASSAGGATAMPLWASVLAGVLMGYLIGGGVVWIFRIVGSLGFAKEALGLGDVHLMAAVGACLGWIDAALAFPLAAVVGLYWVLVHAIANREMPRAMQFGPYLAMATLLVVLGKPLIEMGLTSLLAIEPPNPPVNLP